MRKAALIDPPKPRTFWIAWDIPHWTNALVYQVWVQWPMWVTNSVYTPPGIRTNRIPSGTNWISKVVTNAGGWSTNAHWGWAMPVLWQTVSTNMIPIEATNLGGLFMVKDKDTVTGMTSPLAK